MSHRDIIAIGGSTGAVQAVKQLCMALPGDFPAAIFIVIHVGASSNNILADIVGEKAEFPVRTAAEGEVVEQGSVYVAPADRHLLVVDGIIRLGNGPRENMSRPAIDPLLRSVGLCYGTRAIGVVLTGMLNDGTAGLADLKRCGGTTIVQNPVDAVAPDMPLGALKGSQVDYRAPLSDIGHLLVTLVGQEADPPIAIPGDIHLEVEIALGSGSDGRKISRLAEPVALSCPACGGVLSQIKLGPPLRFRCQVGHAYTAEALAMEKESSVDEALRVALRIIEERAVLTEKMAEDARRSGYNITATLNEKRAKENRTYAETLRRAVSGKL
jgi:two-component system chemotaxis response regulator CheB